MDEDGGGGLAASHFYLWDHLSFLSVGSVVVLLKKNTEMSPGMAARRPLPGSSVAPDVIRV